MLYAWDYLAGLITIDPASGSVADVNPAVVGPNIQSLVVLPDGSMVGGQSSLYAIDKHTGEATEIGGSLPNVRGLEVRGGR